MTLAFGYNDGLVPGVHAAWGARLIVTQTGSVDMLGDRQDTYGDDDRVAALHEWLNRDVQFNPPAHNGYGVDMGQSPLRVALANIGAALREGHLDTRTARPFIAHQDSDGAILANTKASAGYCYVAAYRYADLPEGLGTLGLDKVIEGGGF